ncbi:MAG: hypothetical protein IV090_00610 [Candidatus Sericytochromatia bacterium]|nr:hypothetical protein [Candidatus Sericytochromatia bacterium]
MNFVNLTEPPNNFNEHITQKILVKWSLIALALAGITIFFNLIEAVISVWFGFNNENLALAANKQNVCYSGAGH